MRKPLIVYYSRKGENYWDGQIRSLPKGNTEVVAEMIADITGGDLFEIDTVQPYAAGYRDCVQQAVQTHLALLHQRRQRHGAQRTRSEPGLHGGHCGTRPFHPWVPGGRIPRPGGGLGQTSAVSRFFSQGKSSN